MDGNGGIIHAENVPSGCTAEQFCTLFLQCHVSNVSGRTMRDAMSALSVSDGWLRHSCTLQREGIGSVNDVDISRREDDTMHMVLVDMTGREDTVRSVQNMALELAHRTKNVLAVVQSLAAQTARRTDSFPEFQDRFLDHVDALSSAHDLIADTGWHGVALDDIVRVYIATAHSDVAVEVAPGVDKVILKPNAVQNLAIVLRELATACTLSDRVRCTLALRRDGTVDLGWSCIGAHDSGRIWADMLCRYAPIALDGAGEIDDTDSGFEYRLSIGAQQRV